MTRIQFDDQNARHGVPVSHLQNDEPHEATAPTCRGFTWQGLFYPLSVADDALCDAHDVQQGVRWADEHAWNAERETYLRGERVRLIDPDRAAEMIAVTHGTHVHWDAERQMFVTWPLRDWEKDEQRNKTLDNWAERLKEMADKQE